RDCSRAPRYAPASPPAPSAMPVGQSGATDPCSCAARIVNVTTPATDVTKVDASAAGATSDAGGENRPAADPVDPAYAAHDRRQRNQQRPGNLPDRAARLARGNGLCRREPRSP